MRGNEIVGTFRKQSIRGMDAVKTNNNCLQVRIKLGTDYFYCREIKITLSWVRGTLHVAFDKGQIKFLNYLLWNGITFKGFL